MNQRRIFVLKNYTDEEVLQRLLDEGWTVDRVDSGNLGLAYILVKYEYGPKKQQ